MRKKTIWLVLIGSGFISAPLFAVGLDVRAAQPAPSVVTTTSTPAVSTTPTASTLPAPTPDRYEPNNTHDQATPIEVGGTLAALNLWPSGDVDYFALRIKPGQVGLSLTVQTQADYGLDTALRLLRPDGRELAANDDVGPGAISSRLERIIHEPGYYLIEVTNQAIAAPALKQYALETRLAPAASATAGTPAPTARQPGDRYENNYDFDHAAPIGLGEEIVATFACPRGVPRTCGDNDFYRVPLKGGQCYRAQTRDLDPALDTNLIVFGPERDLAPPLAGNDDAAPGELRSDTTVCLPASYGSFLGYVLVGNAGNLAPPEPIDERTYALRIDVVPPATPTPTRHPAPASPTSPPAGRDPGQQAGAPPVMPGATTSVPVGRPAVTVEELPPRSVPQPSPRPMTVVPVSIRACYDRNQNDFCDVDEGIAGLTVYATTSHSRHIEQALTGRAGIAQFSLRVAEQEQIRISVPYFAAQQTVSARTPRLQDLVLRTVAPVPALLP